MKFLLSSLLLSSLCALSSWSISSGTPVVTQSPDVSVMDGHALNISCCWTGEFWQIKVNWLKNQTEIKSESVSLKHQSVKNGSDTCLNLTFSNIAREDSGIYICRVTVEIPSFAVIQGTGTVITVTATESTNYTSSGHNTVEDSASTENSVSKLSVIVVVAVVVPLFIVTLVCLCVLRRKRGDAARVIYEVPHTDSEAAEVDKHSTSSSRGSSQWCQVPVYESFDYFEHMPKNGKESG